jgi:peptide/nickel transport system substrate-binding protein
MGVRAHPEPTATGSVSRPARTALALFVISATLAGCSRTYTERPGGSQTLVVAHPGEPRSLNPLFESGFYAQELGSLVFQFLLRINDRGELEPEAATRVPSVANGDISRDGLTIDYHIRRGLLWHDGVPLTARDVVFTYREAVNPQNNVDTRYPYDKIQSVRAIDAYHVRVVLKAPWSPMIAAFLANDGNYSILPEHLLRGHASLNSVAFNALPIGSGPYRVAAWKRGDYVTLVANSRYWRGKPHIRQIILRFTPDLATAVTQVQTHEAQADFQALYARTTLEKLLYPTTRTFTGVSMQLVFNSAASPTSELQVRRAVVMGLDVWNIVRKTTLGVFSADHALHGFMSWAYDPAVQRPGYDPLAANRLLDEAGWRRGADGIRMKAGHRLEFQIVGEAGDRATQSLVVHVQQALTALGALARIKIDVVEEFYSRNGPLTLGRFNIALVGIMANYDPEPSWFLACDQRAPIGVNWSRYCDPQLDAWDRAASASLDRSRRISYYALVQQRMMRDIPLVVLYQIDAIAVYAPELQGVRPSFQGPYWNVSDWHWRS